MTFDYIVGNPPYAYISGGKSHRLWDRIVIKAYNLLKPKGEMIMVHPGAWRFATGISDLNLRNIKKIYTTHNVRSMELFGIDEGIEKFGAVTDYDIVTLVKEPIKEETLIRTKTDGEIKIDLSTFNMIPTDNFTLFNKLKAGSNEERVDIIFDSNYHHINNGKSLISDKKDDIYKYPVIYTVTEKQGVVYWYSKSNTNGHFGIPKLILKIGATTPILDLGGKYGMSEFAGAIVDTPENLLKIEKAINHPEFKKLKLYFTGAIVPVNGYIDGMGKMFKFIREFRKDFWKEFYTDEMEQELTKEGKLIYS